MKIDGHTKGPWKVSEIHQCGTHLSPPPQSPLLNVDISAATNPNPCCFVFKEKSKKERRENLANAYLVGAAPLLPRMAEWIEQIPVLLDLAIKQCEKYKEFEGATVYREAKEEIRSLLAEYKEATE